MAPDKASAKDAALGKLNNLRLEVSIMLRDGLGSDANARTAEIQQIGQDIAGRYIEAVDANRGLEPSLSQSNQYHFDVFSAHGLSSETYGGTPLGYSPNGIGKALGDAQSVIINDVFDYCGGCDL